MQYEKETSSYNRENKYEHTYLTQQRSRQLYKCFVISAEEIHKFVIDDKG